MRLRNRVVVTGLGIVAPNGIGIDSFWDSLLNCRSGIGPITLFDASSLKSRIAGEVKNFNPTNYLRSQIKPKRTARHTLLALVASQLAFQDARLDRKDFDDHNPLAIVLGVSTSAFDIIEAGVDQVRKMGADGATPYLVTASPPQAIAAAVAEYMDVPSICLTVSTACASGLDAVMEAAELIRSGKHDVIITGGTDAPISMTPFSNLVAAGLVSTRNEDPEKASRPFDLDRDSGVISEGSGILVLENLEHALSRGVTPYLEITGEATQMDLKQGEPGSGLVGSMESAMVNASCRPDDINYISAHGPGHPVLDRVETEAIKKVLGKRAYSVPVSSIKGVLGNPLSSAGTLQLIACALSIKNSWITPTANYEKPDPYCDLDYVPNQARRSEISRAMINSHGIGGGNTSLVVEKIIS
jgi:3-oxoacyl-[acyl-carrier-protein] synthase II